MNTTTKPMKTKTLKAIGIVFIGLLIWIGFFYLAIAYIKLEPNPFMWSQAIRGLMVGFVLVYCAFIPALIHELKY